MYVHTRYYSALTLCINTVLLNIMHACMQVNTTDCSNCIPTDIFCSDVFHEAFFALCFIVERNSVLEVGCWRSTI